jgi:hypothetical protein
MIVMSECTQERFLNDVKNHEMQIISDDGVSRRIRFKEPGTSCYYFDLITWSGHLCVTGDCGTYVFNRIEDMFEFFRSERINPGYWEEKCISIDRHGGTEKFSPEKFERHVLHTFWSDTSEMPRPERRELWAEIKEEVLPYAHDGQERALDAAMGFKHEDFTFTDFWDHEFNELSFRFIWNLYAIIYGISQYDQKALVAA